MALGSGGEGRGGAGRETGGAAGRQGTCLCRGFGQGVYEGPVGSCLHDPILEYRKSQIEYLLERGRV